MAKSTINIIETALMNLYNANHQESIKQGTSPR